MKRTPNPYSPEEVRRAFQGVQFDTAILSEGALGEIIVGAGTGSKPTWTTSLTTLTLLTVDNITINAATITSSTGAISFDNENLTTTGTVSGINVTSGSDPGHTHTAYQPADGDLTAIAALTGTTGFLKKTAENTWTIDTTGYTTDHGSLSGLGDDDHSQYHTDGRAATWLAAGHETTYNHANYNTAYGWGNHAGLYDPVGTASSAISSHTSLYDHARLDDNYTSAVADSNVLAGHAVYITAAGHAELARADASPNYKVAGLVLAAKSAGQTATIQINGAFELADWTSIVGSASLTPGAIYYLKDGTSTVPSYANAGGTGDRTAIITNTGTQPLWDGYYDGRLVNGLFDYENCSFIGGYAVSPYYIRWDFGAGASKLITEAKWYQSTTDTTGVWQWQGSNDESAWTDIGSTFDLGGAEIQTMSTLSGNASGYRYYQLKGISGNASGTPHFAEIEFKICDYVVADVGEISVTPSATYATLVGHAISSTILNIEIDLPEDHGRLTGLADDDHAQYHTDGRAATWLAAGHETTYNHANYNTAYGWGNHASAGYFIKASDDLDDVSAGTTNVHLTTTLKSSYDGAASHKTTEDAINGLVKCNGAGSYSAVTDSSANWNTAYGWGDHSVAGYIGTILTNTTYYVDTGGNDTTGDGSVGNPWATLAKAMLYLQDYLIANTAAVTINVNAGKYTSSSAISLNHVCGSQIAITGAAAVSKTLSSVVSSSGSACAWSIVLQLDDASGITTDHYVLIGKCTGGTDPYHIAGCHPITSVDADNDRITISTRHSDASAPSGAVAGTVYVIKSILYFTGCDGLVLSNMRAFSSISNLVVAGNRGNTAGLYVYNSSNLTIGNYVGANGFRDGIYVMWKSWFTANTGCYSSDNKEHGMYVGMQSGCQGNTYVLTTNNTNATDGVGVEGVGASLLNISTNFVSCGQSNGLVAYPNCTVYLATGFVVDHCTNYGIYLTQGSYGSLIAGTISNCGVFGLVAYRFVSITTSSLTLSGNAADCNLTWNTVGGVQSYVEH